MVIYNYVSKCWALQRAERQMMNTTDMRMLRCILRKIRGMTESETKCSGELQWSSQSPDMLHKAASPGMPM